MKILRYFVLFRLKNIIKSMLLSQVLSPEQKYMIKLFTGTELQASPVSGVVGFVALTLAPSAASHVTSCHLSPILSFLIFTVAICTLTRKGVGKIK